jgi:anti-sigma regulatory factor (Ser/Thr protein kinase)
MVSATAVRILNTGRHPLHRPTIKFGSTLTARELEKAFADLYQRCGQEPESILLDFQDCSYMDIAALSCLPALLSCRADHDKSTQLRLPRNKRTRDFLALWRFPEAVTEVVQVPFSKLVSPSDRHLLSEPITTFTGHTTGLEALEFNTQWEIGKTKRRNFFEFMTFPVEHQEVGRFSDDTISFPRNEASRWKRELVRAVLKSVLGGEDNQEDEISRIVVFEAIANAVQHPEAKRIQITSRLYRTAAQEDSISANTSIPRELRNFTICIWDDGESMIDTLGRALQRDGKVRSLRFPKSWYERVLLKIRDLDHTLRRQVVVDEGDDPAVNAPAEQLLLSCLFPGITRSIAEKVQPVKKFRRTVQYIDRAGMGLFTLGRTVVDRYGGSIAIRTGKCFINFRLANAYELSTAGERVHYAASVTLFPPEFPRFKGNLLTVRIPLAESKDDGAR